MKDFWYRCPTIIIFGPNGVDEIGELIRPFGEKVLFVFGKSSIKQSGLYQRIREKLESSNLQVIDYSGVQSNPLLSHTREGILLAKKHHVDCILAVGGGSVIDEAKVIAFGALTEQDVWDFFTRKAGKPEEALPIFAIPTLANTGSEMNPVAVITDDENSGQKLGMSARCMAPQIAILDPELTLTVTKQYTVYGLVDTFSHVLEGYFNGDDDVDLPMQDGMCEGLFRSIIKISKQLLENLENYDLRANAMWAASVASNKLLEAGRGRVVAEMHCLAHSTGALFDIPHGAAISISIPAWMTFRQSQKKDKLVQFSKHVFELDGESDDITVVNKGIGAVKEWLASLNAPTSLLEFGVGRDRIPAIIENLEPTALSGGMRNVDREQLKEVIRLMF